jgi:hypothetical protein
MSTPGLSSRPGSSVDCLKIFTTHKWVSWYSLLDVPFRIHSIFSTETPHTLFPPEHDDENNTNIVCTMLQDFKALWYNNATMHAGSKG